MVNYTYNSSLTLDETLRPLIASSHTPPCADENIQPQHYVLWLAWISATVRAWSMGVACSASLVGDEVTIKDGQGNALRCIQLKTGRPKFLAKAPDIPRSTRILQGSDPTMWAMSDVQLVICFNYMQSTSEYKASKQARGYVCLYDVNSLFVIPWSRGCGCGVALLMNAQAPLKAQVMISHAWAEDVEELVSCLSSWASGARSLWSCPEIPLWCCTFAQYQPEDGAGPSLQKQLSLDPFKSVIQSKPRHGMLVVHTTKVDPYTRLWCVHEIDEALDSKLHVRGIGTYSVGGRNVSTQSAKCGDPGDETRIRAAIESKTGGYVHLDNAISAFRNTLVKSGASVFAEIQVPWEDYDPWEGVLQFALTDRMSEEFFGIQVDTTKITLTDQDGRNIPHSGPSGTSSSSSPSSPRLPTLLRPRRRAGFLPRRLETLKGLARQQFPLKLGCAFDVSNGRQQLSQKEAPSVASGTSACSCFGRLPEKSQIMKETNLNAMKHTELCEQKVLCPISKFRENRAISKQVLEILNNSMTEITDVLRVDFSKSDLWHWSVYLRGPWGTPYDAGWFAAEFDLPPDYPFKPPRKFRILTKILHPNIWATGEVCADIFGAAWSPAITLFKMLLSIISLLDTPEPLDPANVEAASLQLNHPELFAEKARLWTQTFAL